MRGSSGLRVDDILVFGSSGSGDGYGICLWFGRFRKVSKPCFPDPARSFFYFFSIPRGARNRRKSQVRKTRVSPMVCHDRRSLDRPFFRK